MERFERHEIIGVIPAAGMARRLGSLPCSKEIFPVGFQSAAGEPARPKAVCQYLLERMHHAGVRKVYIVLRNGKWDIPAHLGDGHQLGMQLAYLMMRLPYGPPFTLDQAFPFLGGALVVMGFPDLLFEPEDGFVKLLQRQGATGADIVLGLFPTDRPHKMDMVELDEDGRVRAIDIKPARTHLRHAWIIAVWTPAFTAFLHAFVQQAQDRFLDLEQGGRELHVGDAIAAALHAGLHVDSVLFPGGSCLDVGTPEDLMQALRDGLEAAVPPQHRR